MRGIHGGAAAHRPHGNASSGRGFLSWSLGDGFAHNGWLAETFDDGFLGEGWDGEDIVVSRSPLGELLPVGEWTTRPVSAVIGWLVLCECGWRGGTWRRVSEPRWENFDARLVHDFDAGADTIELAARDEWGRHAARLNAHTRPSRLVIPSPLGGPGTWDPGERVRRFQQIIVALTGRPHDLNMVSPQESGRDLLLTFAPQNPPRESMISVEVDPAGLLHNCYRGRTGTSSDPEADSRFARAVARTNLPMPDEATVFRVAASHALLAGGVALEDGPSVERPRAADGAAVLGAGVRERLDADVRHFLQECGTEIRELRRRLRDYSDARLGEDLWLAREGRPCGFGDPDLGDGIGAALVAAAESLGSLRP